MSEQAFEQRYQAAWAAFELQLHQGEHGKPVRDAEGFTDAYRHLCRHLALAQGRHYSSALVGRLEHLALRGHRLLYRHRPPLSAQVAHFVLYGLARQVRAQGVFVAVAGAVLFGTLALVAGLVYLYPSLAWNLLPADALAQAEHLYHTGPTQQGRAASGDWAMFGFYVMNNLGIALQTFASGLLLGVGSLFYLFHNGLQIGTLAGHLSHSAAAVPFWSFVIGHSAFELTAVTLAGAAGLQLGWALVAPGPLRRADALKAAAQAALQLVYGVLALLLLAAFVEAYWSARSGIPVAAKFTVGGLLWLGMAAYLMLAGRGRNDT